MELTVIYHGEPQNLTKQHAEFTFLFHGKLWSLFTVYVFMSKMNYDEDDDEDDDES